MPDRYPPKNHTWLKRSGSFGIRHQNCERGGELCEQYRLTGNDIRDAWIAAAVQVNHFRLVSFDKGFQRLLKNSELTLLRP